MNKINILAVIFFAGLAVIAGAVYQSNYDIRNEIVTQDRAEHFKALIKQNQDKIDRLRDVISALESK